MQLLHYPGQSAVVTAIKAQLSQLEGGGGDIDYYYIIPVHKVKHAWLDLWVACIYARVLNGM